MKKNESLTTTSRGVSLSKEDIQTLVSASIIPRDTPEGTIRMFGRFCAESNLSPFKRQVHLIKRGDRFTIQTGIDGYRSIADRTGRYAGNDDYLFDEGLTEYQHIVQKKGTHPVTATATVYKLVGNIRVPFTATARWEEYCPQKGQAFMWEKMPYLMIGKTAESLALRKAFPDELGGVYTDEEMEQAGPIEEVERQPQRQTHEVAPGASVTVFDCTQEAIEKGKYAGVVWKDIPRDYLEWVSGNASNRDWKNKAEATIKYLDGIRDQNEAIDDFAGKFDAPPGEILEHSLADVSRTLDVEKIEAWWKENEAEILKLSKDQQGILRKTWIQAKKEARKS